MLLIAKIILIYFSFWAVNFVDLFLITLFSLVWLFIVALIHRDEKRTLSQKSVPTGFRVFVSSNLWLIIINVLLISLVFTALFGFSINIKRYVDLLILLFFTLFYSIGFRLVYARKNLNSEDELVENDEGEKALTPKEAFENLFTPFFNYRYLYEDWVYETDDNEAE